MLWRNCLNSTMKIVLNSTINAYILPKQNNSSYLKFSARQLGIKTNNLESKLNLTNKPRKGLPNK